MAPLDVAVLDDYQDLARDYGPWERLTGRVRVHTFTDHVDDDEQLAERLARFEVIVAMRERTALSRERLARLPRLALLVTTGLSNAAIDVAAAAEHGIVVSGTTVTGDATPELTWALILALTRRICEEDAAVRAGGWQQGIGPELAGRTLGLVGLGRVGRRVAAYGLAFAMNVIAWSENLDPRHAAGLGVEAVAKDELLARADVISIHTRLSERTRGLIGARELALMRASSYLVNTSRGPIVDEQALLAALQGRQIAGAALDVFDVEPLPAGHPLRSAPNALLTPHIGYVAEDSYRGFYREIVEDIEAFLDGAPIRVLGS
ncbi:MAG: D-2-hydroxyacid dehydrogenase family protein [Solirubrobacteraceae bacterium]|jgi:phosphoglycerate dehydrogenase-like enzyme